VPSLDLSSEEALVLFELCSRFSDSDADTVALVHPAERVALWALTCALESVLSEPLSPDYESLLSTARDRLAAHEAPPPEPGCQP
jgi:hypothetical protein